MRVALTATILGLVAGLIAGGRVRNLVGLRLRRVALVALFPLGVGLAARNVPGAFGWYLLGLAAFVVFAFSNALPVRGMLLVGIGLAANFVVVADNHGMPYRPSSVVAAGAATSRSADLVPRTSVTSHPEGPADQLVILSKIIPVAPLRAVVSFGDVLVAIGLALVVFHGVLGDGTDSSEESAGRRRRRAHRADQAEPRVPSMRDRLAVTGIRPPAASEAGQARATGERAATRGHRPLDAAVASTPVPHAEMPRSGATHPRPSSPEAPNDVWAQRLALLRATGDITVVIDLIDDERSDGAASDRTESVARLAVARALRSPGGHGVVPVGHSGSPGGQGDG